MIRRWEQGRADVDAMLANRQLQRVPANTELARSYLEQASAHLRTSVQGVGGHIAVFDAVMAQFGNVLGDVIRPFASMRRLRNSSEYPSLEDPVANGDDAMRAQVEAEAMIDAAARLIDQLPVH